MVMQVALLFLLVAAEPHATKAAEYSQEMTEKLQEFARDWRTVSTAPLGCYSFGYRFDPAMVNVTGQPFKLSHEQTCQAKCRDTPGCHSFSFLRKGMECYLGGVDAVMVPSDSLGAVSGNSICQQEASSCKQIPGKNFPGKDASESRAAWQGGEQPTNLQCWPRNKHGFPMRCSQYAVLEDVATGWPGLCEGLTLRVTPAEKCQERCRESTLCGVWIVEDQTSNDGSLRCWTGLHGKNCINGNGPKPRSGQAIVHGQHRVLMNTIGMQIKGLTTVFDATDYNSIEEAAEHCRNVCLSYLLCQFWSYSEVYGCQIEDVLHHSVAYPLVNDGVNLHVDTPDAAAVKRGEYLQKFCTSIDRSVPDIGELISPEPPTTTGAAQDVDRRRRTTVSSEESAEEEEAKSKSFTMNSEATTDFKKASGDWKLWLLGALIPICCICCLIAIGIGMMKMGKSKKNKTSRSSADARKVASKPEGDAYRASFAESNQSEGAPLMQDQQMQYQQQMQMLHHQQQMQQYELQQQQHQQHMQPYQQGYEQGYQQQVYQQQMQQYQPHAQPTQQLPPGHYGLTAPPVLPTPPVPPTPPTPPQGLSVEAGMAAFDAVDRNRNGVITRDEWARAATGMAEPGFAGQSAVMQTVGMVPSQMQPAGMMPTQMQNTGMVPMQVPSQMPTYNVPLAGQAQSYGWG